MGGTQHGSRLNPEGKEHGSTTNRLTHTLYWHLSRAVHMVQFEALVSSEKFKSKNPLNSL